MKIEEGIKLDFTDVLIRPKRSTLGSRSEVDLEREYTFVHSKKKWKGIPIIAANMDTTGTIEMYNELSKYKLITCFHKFYNPEEYPLDMNKDFYMISSGTGETDWDKLQKTIDILDPNFVCIDIANGYSTKLIDFTRKVREKYPDKTLVAGNVVTREMVEELTINGGVDIVKCGIGPGCFSKDTKVLMSNGIYKNINKIQIGDYVINKNGKPVRVKNVMNKGYRSVISIKTNNWNTNTIVTPDHRYWMGSLSNNKWIEIDKCNTVTNPLLTPSNIEWDLPSDFKIDLSKYFDNIKFTKYSKLLNSCYELGYIFGILLTNGNINDETFTKAIRYILIARGSILYTSNNYAEGFKKMLQSNDILPHKYYCLNTKYIEGLYTALTKTNTHTNNNLQLLYWCCLNLQKTFTINSNIVKTFSHNKPYIYSILLSKNNVKQMVEVWDIEVDCPTHSFIANNSIVHNSVCTTRIQTGVGYPQLSAVMDCADASHGIDAHVISDGGIKCPGDLGKAFGAGADFCMLGGVFSGHLESGGELVQQNGKTYKKFYGMSSAEAMNKHYGGVARYRSAEGKCVTVEYKGPVENTVLSYLGGLRSTLTYVGAKRLKDLPKCTTFIKVNRQANNIFK